MRSLAILGSTGSIGTQTLEVAASCGHRVLALTAHHNIDLLERQARTFHPILAAAADPTAAAALASRLADTDMQGLAGEEGVLAAAQLPQADTAVTALVGIAGLAPTLAAIDTGKRIALANKETLVCAGPLVMARAREKGAEIVPVDSEHSAIFQSLQGSHGRELKRILLTASGGPFFGWTREALEKVTPDRALQHPNWSMGRKITVDSATMVNKGLEVMEAKWLFGVSLDQVCVVVHPQSILHSAVEFVDGAVIGQMGVPDMRLPIIYALFYPKRKTLHAKKLDLFSVGTLTFEKPDLETFYGLALAYDAMRAGGNVPTVFNAANERAVAKFLDGKIRFLEIPEMISEAMTEVDYIAHPGLEEILSTEQATYEYIESRW